MITGTMDTLYSAFAELHLLASGTWSVCFKGTLLSQRQDTSINSVHLSLKTMSGLLAELKSVRIALS